HELYVGSKESRLKIAQFPLVVGLDQQLAGDIAECGALCLIGLANWQKKIAVGEAQGFEVEIQSAQGARPEAAICLRDIDFRPKEFVGAFEMKSFDGQLPPGVQTQRGKVDLPAFGK